MKFVNILNESDRISICKARSLFGFVSLIKASSALQFVFYMGWIWFTLFTGEKQSTCQVFWKLEGIFLIINNISYLITGLFILYILYYNARSQYNQLFNEELRFHSI